MTGGTPWEGGLGEYGRRLRAGEMTSVEAVGFCLDRIAALDDKHRSFVHVAGALALEAAERVDRELGMGRDLGPLMGVPVAVKDLFAVDGMPTCAGSRLDLADTIGSEGPFVRRLREAGALILGKTRTIEFAAGAHNLHHPTPWNPADPDRHRAPGGSSSGSAVAVAAGFCPLAFGTDTGGSVRLPAALCGIVGYKPTFGRFPLEGIFPLCPAMDSIGFFTRSAEDASLVFAELAGCAPAPSAETGLAGARIGIPPDRVLGDLEDEVASAFDQILRSIEARGGRLTQVDWPSAGEAKTIGAVFGGLVPYDLIATLGCERIERERDRIDPVALDRIGRAAGISDSDYQRLCAERERMATLARDRMSDLEAVIQPTSPICAPPVEELSRVEDAVAFTARSLSLTRHANVYGLCAVSLPIAIRKTLPVGLDVAGAVGFDHKLILLARAIQDHG